MIEIKDLQTSYAYGDPFSVSDLRLEEGKITTIIGKNGSGKSTLLRTMAGQLPYQGSILIHGKQCRDFHAMERAREIAFLPQVVRQVNMDVRTLTEHGRYPYHGNLRRMSSRDEEMIEQALRITEMGAYRNRLLQELSGGERQRAYLAMVVAQDTPMILLDEPTTFMDVSYQASFFQIIQSLKEKGHGIVMSSHNLEQSFAYSDQICLMDQRRIISIGSPEELAKDPNMFRSIFGVTVKRINDPEMLYPYVIGR